MKNEKREIEIKIPKTIFRIVGTFIAVIVGLTTLIGFYDVLPIDSENVVSFLKINIMLTILTLVAIIVLIIKGEKG